MWKWFNNKIAKNSVFAVLLLMAAVTTGCSSGGDSYVVGSRYSTDSGSYEISVDRDLDPSSVNGVTVKMQIHDQLTGRSGPVEGEVNYNSRTRTISVSPRTAYLPVQSPQVSYIVNIVGIRDSAGGGLPPAQVSFPIPRLKTMVSGCGGDEGSYYQTVADETGNSARTLRYTGQGPDGVWFTEDDVIGDYYDSIFEPATGTQRYVSYTSGSDGIWQNNDDEVIGYQLGTYSEGRELWIYFDGRGEDNVWFSTDDEVSGYSVAMYNADGTRSSIISYMNPGPDGNWFTGDDVYSDYTTYLYDGNGNAIRYARSQGTGEDGIPFTADDSLSGATVVSTLPGVYYYSSTYDGNNRLLTQASYYAPGPDRAWFTPDDRYNNFRELSYDSTGKVVRAAYSSGAGPDGIPFTLDDTCNSYFQTTEEVVCYSSVFYTAYSYDGSGNLLRTVHHAGPGADNTWFTEDDGVGSYTAYLVDEAGRQIRSTGFYAPGADMRWFTADDNPFTYTRYVYDGRGNLERRVYYTPGEDLISMEDDEVLFYDAIQYNQQGWITSEVSYYGPGQDEQWFTVDDSFSYMVKRTFFP